MTLAGTSGTGPRPGGFNIGVLPGGGGGGGEDAPKRPVFVDGIPVSFGDIDDDDDVIDVPAIPGLPPTTTNGNGYIA